MGVSRERLVYVGVTSVQGRHASILKKVPFSAARKHTVLVVRTNQLAKIFHNQSFNRLSPDKDNNTAN